MDVATIAMAHSAIDQMMALYESSMNVSSDCERLQLSYMIDPVLLIVQCTYS